MLVGDTGYVYVRVRLGNGGAAAFRFGVPVALYTIRNGEPYLIDVQWSSGVVSPGAVSALIEFAVPVGAIVDDQLIISVDDSGSFDTVPECQEDNNVLFYDNVSCDD